VNKNIHYIDVKSENAVEILGELFLEKIQNEIFSHRRLIILCIGTDRATGDCLGPITGHLLDSSINRHYVSIYGTLDKPVHAKNIRQTLDYIHAAYNDPFIAAVDACLGKSESVGYITIGEGPVNPGAGLSKTLPTAGNISITGIVNVATGMDFSVLQNTRLNLVMKMAEVINSGIGLGLENFEKSYGRMDEKII